ncbi:MAG: hypothetical protein ACRDGV_00840 [Candidatus Limnocylindria bacterium]
MASGRIVVIAVFYGLLGGTALLIGLGPLLQPAGPWIRLAGFVAIATGVTLIAAAAGLLWRGRLGRALGIAGGIAALVLGVMVVGLSLASLESCPGLDDAAQPCFVLVGGIGFIGLLITFAGLGAIAVIRRTRRSFFRPRRP